MVCKTLLWVLLYKQGENCKLGSDAPDQEAEIQITCKVSTRFAGILQCNKRQPTSGKCMSVQEDTAKMSKLDNMLWNFVAISGDVGVLTFSLEVFEV